MTDLVESTVVEVLVELATNTIITSSPESTVIETAAAGADILTETTATDTLTDTQVELVYAVEPVTVLLEVGTQGPTGPAGSTGPTGPGPTAYPGKTIISAGGVVTEVLSYLDAAKTQLAGRKVMAYSLGKLATIQFFDGAGALSKTRTLGYSAGVLTSVVDT